jgi:hypothetical protein
MTRQGLVRTSTTLLALAALALPAAVAGKQTKISKNHCEVIGGGRFVEIPDFPGERIDRRLLKDVEYLRKRFKIYIWDGYSTDRSHTIRGEHPLGLALDIGPDRSIGGTWGHINRLAHWAEPRQNRPRAPFRWVGYWGDKRHGPRDHLHLSWEHSPTKPKRVARTVETIRCPRS